MTDMDRLIVANAFCNHMLFGGNIVVKSYTINVVRHNEMTGYVRARNKLGWEIDAEYIVNPAEIVEIRNVVVRPGAHHQ